MMGQRATTGGTCATTTFLVTLLVTLAGCGGGDRNVVEPPPPLPTDLTLQVRAHPEDAAVAQQLGWAGVIPGAEVTITASKDGGAVQRFTTGVDGTVTLDALAPGSYRVTARRMFTPPELEKLGAGSDAVAFVGEDEVGIGSNTRTATLTLPASRRRSLVIATAGGAVQWPLASGRVLLTATGRLSTLDGHVEQVFPTRQGIESNERVMDGGVQLRLRPTAQGWMAVADLSVRAEQRERTDSIAEARTSVDAITPRLGLEVGRQLSPRLMLSGGYAIARYGGNGTIPGADRRGALYRQLFAPELDMATAVSLAQAVSLSARWHLQGDAALWLTGRMERLTPGAGNEGSFAPGGTRNTRSVWLGVTLTPRMPLAGVMPRE